MGNGCHRYAICDDQWTRIKNFPTGREGHVSGTAADNRLVDADSVFMTIDVGYDRLRLDCVEQRFGLSDVGCLPWRQRESYGLPRASTTAWILVVKPPRERPMAWSSRPSCAPENKRFGKPAEPADAPS
jgi:hypothetical protein